MLHSAAMISLPEQPQHANDKKHWGNLADSQLSYVLSELAQQSQHPICIVTPTMQQAEHLQAELAFFLSQDHTPVWLFPDWEILPYDNFSPHQDIVSERLAIIRKLMLNSTRAVIITSTRSLMNRLAPTHFIVGHCLSCKTGEQFDLQSYRHMLEQSGYQCVNQVITRGEFAVRGSIIDIFPMGSDTPYRIDLFDDEIDSIRTFDIDSQRSEDEVDAIDLLPAHEFPLAKSACDQFIVSLATAV